MRKLGKWLVDKAGGVVVGALLVSGGQWLAGRPDVLPSLVVGGILAFVFGTIAVVFGRASSAESLRAEIVGLKAENADLKARVEEKNNAAIMRDGIIQANEKTIAELRVELTQWRSGGHSL